MRARERVAFGLGGAVLVAAGFAWVFVIPWGGPFLPDACPMNPHLTCGSLGFLVPLIGFAVLLGGGSGLLMLALWPTGVPLGPRQERGGSSR